MKQLKTSFTGGHPLTLNDLAHIQAAYTEALAEMNMTFADHFVLSGCVVTDTAGTLSATAGYIVIDGEVLPVDAHSHVYSNILDVKWGIEEQTVSPSPVTYQNSVSRAVHVRRRAVLTEGGSGVVFYASVTGIASSIADKLATLLGFEPLINLASSGSGIWQAYLGTTPAVKFDFANRIAYLSGVVRGPIDTTGGAVADVPTYNPSQKSILYVPFEAYANTAKGFCRLTIDVDRSMKVTQVAEVNGGSYTNQQIVLYLDGLSYHF